MKIKQMTKKKSNKKTISKKSTKSKAKTSLADIKPKKILNKKNAIEFANYLYDEKNDGKKTYCSYVAMCDGELKEYGGKNPLSCVLGEAYLWFVDNNLSVGKLLKEAGRHSAEIEKYNNDVYGNDYEVNGNDYEVKDQLYFDGETLISYILAKNSATKNVAKLERALNALPSNNDDGCYYDKEEYIIRAKNVKEFWMKKIVPLLK